MNQALEDACHIIRMLALLLVSGYNKYQVAFTIGRYVRDKSVVHIPRQQYQLFTWPSTANSKTHSGLTFWDIRLGLL